MKDESEKKKDKTFFHTLFSRFGYPVISVIIMVTIIILMVHNRTKYKEDIIALESKMTEEIAMQADYILENLQSLYSAGFAAVISKIEDADAASASGFNSTNGRIQRINTVYAEFLAEMEKKTLDSLYTEAVLVDMEKEALDLFRKGKYAHASSQYAILAEAQPENAKARFYYLYSMFLNNKLDRSNYPYLKDGLQALERNGFVRSEIRDVLEFIDIEENGLNTESFE